MVFNHDAWMMRSAERQGVIEEAAREAHEYVDSQQSVGDNEAYIRLSTALLTVLGERQEKRPFDQKLDEIMKRKAADFYEKMAAASQSEFEADAMALALAKKFLESGTSQVLSDLGIWESNTFNKDARASG